MRILLLVLLSLSSVLQAAQLDDAKGYNKNSSLQWQWAMSALEKYPWNGTERVLDIGCGDGKVSAFISQHCTKGFVAGLDMSPSMLQFATSTFRREHFPSLLYLQGDITSLPFTEQFDLVVAFCALHYVVEQEKALQSIFQALCPKGSLVFVGPGLDATSVGNISEALVKTDKWAPHFPSFKKQRAYYTQDEYTALLNRAGFEVVYFDVTYDNVQFANKKALTDWLRPFMNFVSHLEEPLREQFIEEVADVMIQSAFTTNPIILNSSLFECHAKRKS
jgi:trans-aconitate methyltransferase